MARHRAVEPVEAAEQVRQHQGWAAMILAVLLTAMFVVVLFLCCVGCAAKGWS